MPMLWGRVAWFAGFATAVALALWMRSCDFSWLASVGLTVAVWAPFLLSQFFIHLPNRAGSLAMLTAMRRASSLVMRLAADRRPASSS